jgi:hypothetical protein
MNEEMLVKLLQIQFEHERKLAEFAGRMNLDYFEVDLLGVVLDAVGVPADNSLEQMGKYGYGQWLDRPETFSRLWYYEAFQRQVVQGTAEECRAYLEMVRETRISYYLVELDVHQWMAMAG